MELLCKLIGIKKEDLDELEEWLFDCEINQGEIIDFIRDQIEEQECNLWHINLKQLVFEYILLKADMGEMVDYISINPKTNELTINATKERIDEMMDNVLVEDRNDCWLFLAEYLGVNIKIEDQKN